MKNNGRSRDQFMQKALSDSVTDLPSVLEAVFWESHVI
jgi:hypothetical protein